MKLLLYLPKAMKTGKYAKAYCISAEDEPLGLVFSHMFFLKMTRTNVRRFKF